MAEQSVPKKKKVPSDLSSSPLPDRHARSKLSSQRSGDVSLLLPVTALIPLRIGAPKPIRLAYLLEAYASEQPFARPQRLLSFESHRGKVSAPGLSLRRNSELFFQPVRPCTPTLDSVFRASRDARRTKPVAVSQAQNSQTSIQLSLPFGTFVPPDRSAQSAARSEKLTLVPGPFSLRSPKASITVNNYPPSDHRSRFATVHQAYCSLNLLEPCP
jgi:hypothetical protein